MKRRIRRGEVFWVDPGPVVGTEQAGRRPYLVVSHDVFNDRTGTAIAFAVTSAPPKAGFPLTWALASGRLPKRSWMKIGQVRTVSTLRLARRLGRVDLDEVNRMVEGLFDIVGP